MTSRSKSDGDNPDELDMRLRDPNEIRLEEPNLSAEDLSKLVAGVTIAVVIASICVIILFIRSLLEG